MTYKLFFTKSKEGNMCKLVRGLLLLVGAVLVQAFILLFVLPCVSEAGGPYQVYAVPACKILDTRYGSGDDFGGTRNRLAPGETMSIDVTEGFIAGQGGESNCNVPFPEATGVFINVVTLKMSNAVQVQHPKNNGLFIYPFLSAKPSNPSMRYNPLSYTSNSIFVPLCTDASPSGAGCGDDITITNGWNAYVDLYIVVTGYVRP
jgi:hypothetical protein